MLGNGRRSQYNVSQAISLVSVKVALSSNKLHLVCHVVPLISHFLYLPDILLLYGLLLPPVPSRSLCISLSFLVCLFGRLRVVYLHGNRSFTTWQRHERLLAFRAHAGAAEARPTKHI